MITLTYTNDEYLFLRAAHNYREKHLHFSFRCLFFYGASIVVSVYQSAAHHKSQTERPFGCC